MNKHNATILAKIVSKEQIIDMLMSAYNSILDGEWSTPSRINPSLAKWQAWDVFTDGFIENPSYQPCHFSKRNMIWQFGEYLPPHILQKLPIKKEQSKIDIRKGYPNNYYLFERIWLKNE